MIISKTKTNYNTTLFVFFSLKLIFLHIKIIVLAQNSNIFHIMKAEVF